MKIKHGISFGTSCMNRTPHLDHVYINNIETALSVSDECRFVLLNYNSQDGMHKWVQSELKKYIEKGIVKYLHTTKPTTFSQAITKNIVTKHGLCDVVSTLDADNELTPMYVKALLQCYNQPETYYTDKREWFKTELACTPRAQRRWRKSARKELVEASKHLLIHAAALPHVSGRVTCYKKDLLEIGGYDESMTGWGYEEVDFINRHKKYYKQDRILLVDNGFNQSEEYKTLILGNNNLSEIPTTSHEETRRNDENRTISQNNINSNILVVNNGRMWGNI